GSRRRASSTWPSASAASARSACSRTRRRCSRASSGPSRRPPRATTCSRWRSPPPWGRASASTPQPCAPLREDGSMKRAEKIDRVRELQDDLGRATVAVLAEYRGLTVGQMNRFRRAVREAHGRCRVAKNTLARRAVTASRYEKLGPMLESPLALLLGFLQAPATQLLRTLNEPAARVARLVDAIGKRAGSGAGEGNAAS